MASGASSATPPHVSTSSSQLFPFLQNLLFCSIVAYFLSVTNAEQTEYHVVIRPDAEHLPEVAKGDWSVCLKPEVSIVVGWCQVTAFTVIKKQRRQRIKLHT